MEITIFKEITTEGVITSIEENSKKYHEGFYADMSNAPERKLVKESAAEIGDIIKTLKTSRIAITKANTAKVNKEHDSIVARLEAANLPFTLLIDEYKEKRAKILADEKRVIELRELAERKEDDHEMGLLMDKTYAFDKAEELRIQTDRDDQIRKQAGIDAEARQKQSILDGLERERNAENARLADVEHVRGINVAILESMVAHGLPEHESRGFIQTLARKQLPQLTINY